MSVYVVFFGGYQSTQPNIDVWLATARKQCGEDVDYDAIPWPPGANFDAHSAVSTFTNMGGGNLYDSVLTQIATCSAEQVYIVGHSSGCAIANKVDSDLKDHSRIRLVALDGFLPNADQMARVDEKKQFTTQVWSALGGGGVSLNYPDLYKRIGGRLKIHRPTQCSTTWALHFSLVNAAATDNVVKDISSGYAQCRANLIWLD
jgi:hypothetical protein